MDVIQPQVVNVDHLQKFQFQPQPLPKFQPQPLSKFQPQIQLQPQVMCSSCKTNFEVKGAGLCIKCLVPSCSRCKGPRTDVAYRTCHKCRELCRTRKREAYWKEKAKNNVLVQKDVSSIPPRTDGSQESVPALVLSPAPAPAPISFDGLSTVVSMFLGWIPGIFLNRASWDGAERSTEIKIQDRTVRISVTFV